MVAFAYARTFQVPPQIGGGVQVDRKGQPYYTRVALRHDLRVVGHVKTICGRSHFILENEQDPVAFCRRYWEVGMG